MLPKGFVKKKTVHIIFDNSDGKQQTILGDNTTYNWYDLSAKKCSGECKYSNKRRRYDDRYL